MKLFHNFFCRDIEAMSRFYQAVLELPEDAVSHSPIYRAVATPQFQFGFHASAAYDLLQLSERKPDGTRALRPETTGYPTFMLDTPAAVDAAVQRALAHGGRCIKGPYATYYGEWQAVMADPEDHVFRFSTLGLPAGVSAPALQLPAAP
ncbi:VOC family protein [Ottowia sp.]|uniref:VOC family protein n=1 Tax=Ottowia sp. TaxID=1898956 RepID=UPI0039E2DBDF